MGCSAPTTPYRTATSGFSTSDLHVAVLDQVFPCSVNIGDGLIGVFGPILVEGVGVPLPPLDPRLKRIDVVGHPLGHPVDFLNGNLWEGIHPLLPGRGHEWLEFVHPLADGLQGTSCHVTPLGS